MSSCTCGKQQVRLTAVQGDTFNRTFTLTTWDGNEFVPTDLTGATAELILALDDQVVQHPLTIEDAAGGVISASVAAEDTFLWGMSSGPQQLTRRGSVDWRLQVRVTFPDGVVETIVLGTLCVTREVVA